MTATGTKPAATDDIERPDDIDPDAWAASRDVAQERRLHSAALLADGLDYDPAPIREAIREHRIERVRENASRAEMARSMQAMFDASHVCVVCRAPNIATTRHVGGSQWSGDALAVQCCGACHSALIVEWQARCGAQTVDGRSRAELAAAWLDKRG